MPIDWSQLIPGIISTFIGFVLALLGQFLWERVKDYNYSKSLKNRIIEELEIIKRILKNLSSQSLDIQPLKTPVWDEAISAGQVSNLNVECREAVFNIYKRIQEYNSWFAIQTEYYFRTNGCYNELLRIELDKKKEELLDSVGVDNLISIDNVISILAGEK